MKLYEITKQFAELNTLAEQDDLSDEMIADTLEGLRGDFTSKSVSVGKLIKNLEADAQAIDEAAATMLNRAQRVRNRADRVRAYLLFNMQSASITRIESPWFVLAVRKNPEAVVIMEGAQIPDEYMVQPPAPPPHADKKKLKEALHAGVHIDRVYLDQGERLDIKL